MPKSQVCKAGEATLHKRLPYIDRDRKDHTPRRISQRQNKEVQAYEIIWKEEKVRGKLTRRPGPSEIKEYGIRAGRRRTRAKDEPLKL